MNWQPIETAPKDGTYILAFRADPLMHWEVVAWDEEDGGWCYAGEYYIHATHWMPLPAPPTT